MEEFYEMIANAICKRYTINDNVLQLENKCKIYLLLDKKTIAIKYYIKNTTNFCIVHIVEDIWVIKFAQILKKYSVANAKWNDKLENLSNTVLQGMISEK